MPAPVKAEIYGYLKTALVTGDDPLNPVRQPGQRKAFLKVVNGVTVPGELPEAVDDLAEAIAEGLANQWMVWQLRQPIGGVTPGSSIVPGPGALP